MFISHASESISKILLKRRSKVNTPPSFVDNGPLPIPIGISKEESKIIMQIKNSPRSAVYETTSVTACDTL